MKERTKRQLTVGEYERLVELPYWDRWFAGVIGFVLIWTGLCFFVGPPLRDSSENTDAKETTSEKGAAFTKTTLTNKTSKTAAEMNGLILLMVGAGVGLIVYGLNGRRLTKFEAPGVKGETGEMPHTLDADDATPTPVAAPSTDTAQTVAPPTEPATTLRWERSQHPAVQHGTDTVHTFLLRSSWNGLKILKACQWAQNNNRILKLREVVNVGTQMSYDYAYGYFIASFSAGLFVGYADPTKGEAVIAEVHPTLNERIDEIIQGAINTSGLEQAAFRRADLNALSDYLQSTVNPFSVSGSLTGRVS